MTAACLQDAKYLLSSMNLSMDPCKDFYEFACGGWMKNHKIPKSESGWDQFTALQRKVDNQIINILKEPKTPFDIYLIQNIKDIYNTCLDTVQLEILDVFPLLKLLEEFGGWPLISQQWNPNSFSWQNNLIKLKQYNIGSFISLDVIKDMKNTSRHVISIDQVYLQLPNLFYKDSKTYKPQMDVYLEWIIESAKLLKSDYDNEYLEREVKKLINFETQLANIISPDEDRRDFTKLYKLVTLKQLQKWTDDASVQNVNNKINWLTSIRDLFKNTSIIITEHTEVIVIELDYLIKLIELIDKTPVQVIANYMGWQIIQKFSRETTEEMRKLSLQINKVVYGIEEDISREKECVDIISTFLSQIINYQYINKYFDDKLKPKVTEMTQLIHIEFINQIHSLNWMDTDTKIASIEKLKAMKSIIGYADGLKNISFLNLNYQELEIFPNHFDNVVFLNKFHVKKKLLKLMKSGKIDIYEMDWTSVNSFNDLQMNSINILSAMIQFPFYNMDRIEALNYGSLGSIIGHEISHCFDDQGRQLDKHGNLANWWSQNTINSYLNKIECFINQYSKYRLPELDEIMQTNATLNGIRTQGENIADYGGLYQSFKAYKHYIEKKGKEQRLPGDLKKFNSDQLFFIGFANTWCHVSSLQELLSTVLADDHSPNRYRVIGTLSNSKEFSNAFKCPTESSMNPIQKCTLW